MRRAYGVAVVLALSMALVIAVAPSAAQSGDQEAQPAASPADTTDRRPELLAHLGSPDAWLVTADEVDGELVRFESWMYHEAATQIDLVDGEILWSVHIDPLPGGTLYPLAYRPDQFALLSSPDEIGSAFPDLRLEKVELEDESVPGAMFLVGEQLLLGFVEDRLVYAEAMTLAPES